MGGAECERCGIIFKRVEAREERRKVVESAARMPERSSSGLGRFLAIALLIAAASGITWYLTSKGKEAPAGAAQSPGVEQTAAQTPLAPDESLQDRSELQEAPARDFSFSEEKQPGVSGNIVEMARNATVSIITPQGQGSGFFLLDTYIVTNKHVVSALDDEEAEKIKKQLEEFRRRIRLEQEALAELRRDLEQMADNASRRQLVDILLRREAQLAEAIKTEKKETERLRQLVQPIAASDIKIVFADGREQGILDFRLSEQHDLAVLFVSTPHKEVLKVATKNLHQGDKVYAIGNPKGFSHTVTSGVFSGYQKLLDTGETMLQTDTPINPGNSGGPLIDEEGRVHGINTRKRLDAEGIGFAIPIQVVIEDFHLNL